MTTASDTALPLVMQFARELTERDNGQALLLALEQLEKSNPGLGWLSLWKVARYGDRPEHARTLAYALARFGFDQRVTEAVLLWLLKSWAGDDLSTLTNVLTSLQNALDDDAQYAILRTSSASVAPFLLRCVDHSEPLVVGNVLDLLDVVVDTGVLSYVVHRAAGVALADSLSKRLLGFDDEHERQVLDRLTPMLRSSDLPEVVRANPDALRTLAAVVQDLASHFSDQIGNVDDLARPIREELSINEGHGPPLSNAPDLEALRASASLSTRYERQLARVRRAGHKTNAIESAVEGVMEHLPASGNALVIYGDPQSGKTEMMICLTAKLLDSGHMTIVHLMNDSVDLLRQNLGRFQSAGLAPIPRNAADLAQSPLAPGQAAILFCKKNAKDLPKLIAAISSARPIVVIDDEADYATPNASVNKQSGTTINTLVKELLGSDGTYIGVTATPARLDLNNTFDNTTESWVRFEPHEAYTGQDAFFPLDGLVRYRLTEIVEQPSEKHVRRALARFLATSAYLNIYVNQEEQNYSFLVHTSGRVLAHNADRKIVEAAMQDLQQPQAPGFDEFASLIFFEAQTLYKGADAARISKYVVSNASRASFMILNNKRDRLIENATVPSSPFTTIFGGNIVSRGVTFPNLLAMYFTRDVAHKLQQDTYIQRARMFGSRGEYLDHFELTIPRDLYRDWHRCFVFHRLALQSMESDRGSPVWLGDKRISIVQTSSIDRSTVDLDRGEMSFPMFDVGDVAALDSIVEQDPTSLQTLEALAENIGDAMPEFLIAYLRTALSRNPGSLAIHTATQVSYSDEKVVETISRKKGFMGTPQLERGQFPNAVHHVKIFYNASGRARVFYKNESGIQFVQNMKNQPGESQ